ncbi:MAG: hypothetical protein RLZZ123_982 [Pseudomonadota bacterium]
MNRSHSSRPMGWTHIVRLGLVQACLGAMVVLATSTLNRIMVVELALPALVPGLLVGFHYVIQMVRPRMGYGADQGRRCTPWMIGGVTTLAIGGVLASVGTTHMAHAQGQGLALTALAFGLIGLGVSAAGTSLLTLMSKRVPEAMRAPAATTVWVMMIMGFALTAVSVGRLIEPYSPQRLIDVTAGLACVIVVVTVLALWGLESGTQPLAEADPGTRMRSLGDFRQAMAQVWQDPQAKLFTWFVFLSMLAYSSQDLVLEPFAGAIFGMSPGETTQLSGVHHSGVLIGMLAVALAGSRRVAGRLGSVQAWMVGGCLVSALAMAGLATAGLQGGTWPLKANVVCLGVANGAFSIAAIATMMRLANAGGDQSQGTRMGLWGAAQALAFGLGGVLGTALSDLAHGVWGESGWAYASVFSMEAVMFMVSALCAVHVGRFSLASSHAEMSARPALGQKGLS